MQLFKYETTFENISLTDVKTMMRVYCKIRPYTQLFDLHWRLCV